MLGQWTAIRTLNTSKHKFRALSISPAFIYGGPDLPMSQRLAGLEAWKPNKRGKRRDLRKHVRGGQCDNCIIQIERFLDPGSPRLGFMGGGNIYIWTREDVEMTWKH